MPPQEPVKESEIGPMDSTVEIGGRVFLDERQPLENKYELHKEALIEGLPNIRQEDLNAARKKVQETLDELDNGKKPSEYDATYEDCQGMKVSLNTLGTLRALKNHEPIFEDLAKRQVYPLLTAYKSMYHFFAGEEYSDSLGDMVYQLQQVVENLAGSRFPTELKAQKEAEDKRNKTKLDADRDMLSKKTVRG